MAFQNDDISINTFIGAGSAVAGDMRISGFIRIDGDIAGNLEIRISPATAEPAPINVLMEISSF